MAWVDFYNTIRPHSSLYAMTPHEAYWKSKKIYNMGLIPCYNGKRPMIHTYPPSAP
ncbi:integrase core domain-containing protein [Paremcibacter congregatus]|uniref:Uncharacterized protein n=1 Tax=Paremcibacter congregatus TaxID=2043170 RepID=A0A2G4YR04_9PROT|nr:hypothetical protein CRD36_10745 [Paremcibacter congregatus]QDE28947.1 transposase [Paremcibacter congregatus]